MYILYQSSGIRMAAANAKKKTDLELSKNQVGTKHWARSLNRQDEDVIINRKRI